jgi:hypothetical protein
MKENEVVIVIPTHKSRLEKFEKISFRQCMKILGAYPIRIVCPPGTDVSYFKGIAPQIEIDRVPRSWMASERAYASMMVKPHFYNMYSGFKYILTYQLDAFVFSDRLREWCERDMDFIGAPWFEGFDKALSFHLMGVGNSGFCLRKTQSFLEVSKKWTFLDKVLSSITFQRNNVRQNRLLFALWELQIMMTPGYCGPEDIFWGFKVPSRYKKFKVANVDDAMRFSFEYNPRYLYKLLGEQLPFGCHAWQKTDIDFWKPFIERQGYDISGLGAGRSGG